MSITIIKGTYSLTLTVNQSEVTVNTKVISYEANTFNTEKTTIVNNDRFAGLNSENSNSSVYWLWSKVKSTLKTYFDNLYQAAGNYFNKTSDTLDNVPDGTTYKLLTATKNTILDNTSGSNTGDQDISGKVDKVAGSSLVADTEINKLAGIEAGADVNNISDINATDLTDGGETNLHSHAGGGGGITISPWFALTGAYASTSTFTFTGTAAQALAMQHCFFTCLDTAGTTRRIGYIKSATESAGTVTAIVVTDTNLAANDKEFKITPSLKIGNYQNLITVPEELVVDATNPQGLWIDNIKVDSYLLPVDSAVRTAAVGAGAAATFNLYKDATALFSSAQDLTTNNILVELRPTTNTISATDTVSLRVTASAGATNKAKDLQVRLYIVPQSLFTGAA